ncbi:hypothetical protein J2X55_002411 [Microbacterium sp. 1154]|uniref:hypothetical protein n=1 Tax=Microbacterium sp. 1154 TaxID=2817733 RepID=UPI002855D6DC|nr:hypothetical protein [Microbacterium sp. 1154]MDR6691488.1 hypothetical protein [Microbacterium sp. 1154]
MATDVKKHSTIAAGEAPKRDALAKALLSISDVVPTANATEQAQIVDALAGGDFPVSAARPLATTRGDARPLHQIEVSRGGVFVPTSGVLSFATKTAADNWASANGSLLSPGDQCVIGAGQYLWDGTAWRRPVEVEPGVSPTSFVFMQMGTSVMNVDGNGNGMNIGFYRPFPNGVLSTVVTDGDAGGGGALRGVINPTKNGFTALWAAGAAGLRRANWVAVGF